MDRLMSMRVFQKVIDEGGFAAAARALDMSPAVVTRFIADLERLCPAELGRPYGENRPCGSNRFTAGEHQTFTLFSAASRSCTRPGQSSSGRWY